jgi:hypothetical protein
MRFDRQKALQVIREKLNGKIFAADYPVMANFKKKFKEGGEYENIYKGKTVLLNCHMTLSTLLIVEF